MIPTFPITGYAVSTLGLDATVSELVSWLDTAEPEPSRYFVCGNPYSFEVAREDPEFAAAIHAARLVCADGVGVVVASRLLRGGVPERVCGPDVFLSVCRRLELERPGVRMFFLGSSEANLAEMATRFRKEFPSLVIAGTLSPPFKPEFSRDDDASMINAVNDSGAEVLWLGLGAPKQEKWAYRNRNRLKVRLIGPVGALFDFYTGRVKQPPRWMRSLGGYTLFRLFQEPVRVGRRLANDFKFMMRALWHAFPPVRK